MLQDETVETQSEKNVLLTHLYSFIKGQNIYMLIASRNVIITFIQLCDC